jgi:hypothetical protein
MFNVEGEIKARQECSHVFIATNWSKTDKSQSATQFMCQKCLVTLSMQVVAELQQAVIQYEINEFNKAKAKKEAEEKKAMDERKVVKASDVDLDSLPQDVREAVEKARAEKEAQK